MQLYCETFGRGREIVLLHGWGLHGGIWGVFAQRLSEHWRTVVPDLPGHGRSEWNGVLSAMDAPSWCDAVVGEISRLLTGRAIWIGWSLGGLLALTAALRYPQAIERLILIDTTPKFTQDTTWTCAMPPQLLDQFETDLANDQAAGLRRFLSLMFGSSATDRAALRIVWKEFLGHGTPGIEALRMGLHILRHTDLRSSLSRLHVPALIVHGGQDRLVPTGAAQFLAQSLPDAQVELIAPASHAPFITHPEAVARPLVAFLRA